AAVAHDLGAANLKSVLKVQDRPPVEHGREGIGGIESWCLGGEGLKYVPESQEAVAFAGKFLETVGAIHAGSRHDESRPVDEKPNLGQMILSLLLVQLRVARRVAVQKLIAKSELIDVTRIKNAVLILFCNAREFQKHRRLVCWWDGEHGSADGAF